MFSNGNFSAVLLFYLFLLTHAQFPKMTCFLFGWLCLGVSPTRMPLPDRSTASGKITLCSPGQEVVPQMRVWPSSLCLSHADTLHGDTVSAVACTCRACVCLHS